MNSMLLGAGIGVLIALSWSIRSKNKGTDIAWRAIVGAFVGLTVGGVFAWLVGYNLAPLEKNGWYISIVSLNNKTGTAGSFLRIDQETNYHYWYPTNGGFREGTLRGIRNPLILQEDRKDGTFNWSITHCDNWQYHDWVFCPEWEGDYAFHVPNGTIVEDYRLE